MYWVGILSSRCSGPNSRGIIKLWGEPQSNDIVNGRSTNFDTAFAFDYEQQLAEATHVTTSHQPVPTLFRWKAPTAASLASAEANFDNGSGHEGPDVAHDSGTQTRATSRMDEPPNNESATSGEARSSSTHRRFVNPLLSANPAIVSFHATFNRRVYKLVKRSISLRQDSNSIRAALLGEE